MYKNILVAIDGSGPSNNALEHAAALAGQCGARLVLAHVLLRDAPVAELARIAEENGFKDDIAADLDDVKIVPTMPPGSAAAPIVVMDDELLRKFAAELLRAAGAKAREHGVEEVDSRELDDAPAAAILACADAEEIDLIVTGSRGHGEIKTLVLGSVSHKILENAACPCLVVK